MLGGDIEGLYTSEFPFTQAKLALICKLIASPNEVGKPYQLELRLTGPTGERVTSIGECTIEFEPNDVVPNDDSELGLVGDVGPVEFATPGTYWMRVLVNGEEMGATRLYVGEDKSRQAAQGD